MIVPMKKFYLIVLDSDVAAMPARLRKLGIAHVESLQGTGETYQSLEREKADADAVYYLLQNYVDKKSKTVRAQSSFASDTGIESAKELVDRVSNLKRELDAISERTSQLTREIERAESWGEVSTAMLPQHNTQPRFGLLFYEAPVKELSRIPEKIEYFRVRAPKGKLRIAVMVPPELGSAELPSTFQEFALPEMTGAEMRRQIESLNDKKSELNDALKAQAQSIGTVKSYLEVLDSEITLERLRSGMPAHERFSYLTGYVPTRECEKFKQVAAKNSWGLAFNEPADDELPPTLVENRPAIRIIEPIFEFLGTVPNYREYDISGWFLGFFALFFAMIFGDGGYGSLIVLASGASIVLARQKGKRIGDAQKLFLFLGVVTVLWGALTGSWFGIQFTHLPRFLQNISLPFINGQSPDSESNIKIFCFIIGLVQLSIAHIKNIRRDFHSIKALAQAGSLLLLAGMFDAALNLVIDSQRFPIQNWALACIAIGFALVFIFGSWTGKLGSSLVESLKGIIPTFLGTVSVFADIVSYIRLWAVGLAGLAISQTVNGMASGIIGGTAGFIFGFILKLFIAVALLLVSHSLNFVLTILSVVVHGIRLNMLEFSGHLGMEWSGYKYDPLREPRDPSAAMRTTLEETGL